MPKIVYIAHQIGGAVQDNVRAVLRICRELHSPEIIPFAPYIAALQYLNDDVPEDRLLGVTANREYFRRRVMDEVWLAGPRISPGMRDEVLLSIKYGIPVVAYNPRLQPSLDAILREADLT